VGVDSGLDRGGLSGLGFGKQLDASQLLDRVKPPVWLAMQMQSRVAAKTINDK
jgi:hypothetical protein